MCSFPFPFSSVSKLSVRLSKPLEDSSVAKCGVFTLEDSRDGTSRWLRWSQSPSRTSFRGGSASPGRGKRSSHSRSPQSRWANEDCQEEQFSLDFVSVVDNLHSLNELLEALSESQKIRSFHAALEDDDQPAASYKLPIGDASADIDDKVLSMSSGVHSQKVSKLLQYLGVCSRKFYYFEGEDLTKAKALNRHVTELAALGSFDNLS